MIPTSALPFLHVALAGASVFPTQDSALRQRVCDALLSLGSPRGFDLQYSTFEVLSTSELGDRVKQLFVPGSACSTDLSSLVDGLTAASKEIPRSVPQQLDDIAKHGVPDYARKSGLLLGGGPMFFQVLQGKTLFTQSCLSDPAYFSIVRAPQYDVLYFPEISRLEISVRNDSMTLFTPSVYCFPLPVATADVSYLAQAHWDVASITDQLCEIRIPIGGSDQGIVTLVMGGPEGKFPIYCSRSPSDRQNQNGLVALFAWKFDGEQPGLRAVLHAQQSPRQLSVVYYQFDTQHLLTTDDDCVMVIPQPRSIIDSRSRQVRTLKTADLPADVAKLLVITH